jgi:thymidylate synthase
MRKAENYFIGNLIDILEHGCKDENPRPKYQSDGEPAHTIYTTQVFETYDISKNEIPITELRPIPVKNGIKEIQWIYQDETSDLSILENKYGIKWWRDWDVGDGTIGTRYGETVYKWDLITKFLHGLKYDPFGRRHIISLWQEKDLQKPGLNPCAFLVMGSVRKMSDGKYFDLTLTQRSSDYLVAGHINKMQYVAFMMMVAKHCGYKVGKFAHIVQNLHIYDRHVEQAEELLSRKIPNSDVKFELNVPDGTSFYDIQASHFKLINYNPIRPQLKFDLGV